MLSKTYLLRQAETLLKMAHATRDGETSLNLAAKAAELKSKSDAAPHGADQDLRAPDVEQKPDVDRKESS
jgi:hypothetical protein